jgi:FkbM family methyltransferase
MRKFLKQIIKKTFNQVGLDITRVSKFATVATHSFLGLSRIPIRSIIDVGANTGQFARIISKVFPGSDIYCFEPLPESFKELKKWKEKQNRKVEIFNVALGENDGTVEMFNHIDHNTSSSVLKTTELSKQIYPFTKRQLPIFVKMTTLDKWYEDNAILKPQILIKLDVQGYEDRVISGGKKYLVWQRLVFWRSI